MAAISLKVTASKPSLSRTVSACRLFLGGDHYVVVPFVPFESS
jgi:hypothetical protein